MAIRIRTAFFPSLVLVITMLTATSCDRLGKKKKVRITIGELPESPTWYYIFLANRDSGRSNEETYEYSFGGGNVVIVDTNDPDLPDKVQVYHKGKPLDKEIKLNYIGENEHNGIKFLNYSTLVAQPEFEFSDSTDPNAGPRSAHSDYWLYQSKSAEETIELVEAIFAK